MTAIRCCRYEKDHTHRSLHDVYYRDSISIPVLSQCPESVQVGIPLKCSIDSNFPAGTTFDVAMYQSGYTATPVKSQTMTIQENNPTQYLDTGYQGITRWAIQGGDRFRG